MNILVQTPLGILDNTEARKKLDEAGIKVDKETYRPLLIDTEIWESDPEKPGYLRYVKQMSVGDVFNRLKEYLSHYAPDWKDVLDYLHVDSDITCRDKGLDDDFPKYDGYMKCYLVTGSSEGHYIHVDVNNKLVFLGKTFAGPDKGWEIVQAIATILRA
jgi:hypothetical protein